MIEKNQVAIIRRELLELTGNYKLAIILNQFIYWSAIKIASDKMIAKELEILEKEGEKLNYRPTKGWIYKSAEEISEETMMGLSKSNIRKYIKELVDRGFLLERTNPNVRWDRTLQYFVNLGYIQQELHKLGYNLHGYNLSEKMEINETEHPSFKTELQSNKTELQNAQNSTAIPENTIENTINNNIKEIYKEKSVKKKAVKHCMGEYENVYLTDEELEKLKTEFPTDWSWRLENLSEYIASSGKKYKNHLATIRSWARKDKKLKNAEQHRREDMTDLDHLF